MKRLTIEKKLQALSSKYYDFQEWQPKQGDFYTSARNDLELYRIAKIENGKVYTEYYHTEYCDRPNGELSEWDLDGFTTEGFGVQRVYVPLWILDSNI